MKLRRNPGLSAVSVASSGRKSNHDSRAFACAAPQLHRPSNGLGTIPEALEAGARALRRVAHPVVEDLDAEPVHSPDDADLERGGPLILLAVRNRLGDNVVRDCLSRLVNPTRR